MEPDDAAGAFAEFVAVVKALRTPETGCPWDLEQDHRTLRKYLAEECAEVLDAIDLGDDRALCEELGDLLLQIVLHAQVAADRGAFSIGPVIRGITAKMIRRHPHVFGGLRVSGSAEVVRNWEQIKAAEQGSAPEKRVSSAGLSRLSWGLPVLLHLQRTIQQAEPGNPDCAALLEVLSQTHGLIERLERLQRHLSPEGKDLTPHELGQAWRAAENESRRD
jgi:XTP/dITP diphosphohydrolase